MANRRDFLQSGLAASAAFAGVLPAWSALAGAADVSRLRLERFVFDRRFDEAIEAAGLMSARGIPLAEMAGDLTSLWYHELDLRWKRSPMTLAGVTTKSAVFVLETLAADRGMRVLFRGEHTAPQAGGIVHTFAGPSALVADAAEGAQTDWRRWPRALSGALTRCSAARSTATRLVCRTPRVAAGADRREPLYSWIIAPRSAVGATV